MGELFIVIEITRMILTFNVYPKVFSTMLSKE